MSEGGASLKRGVAKREEQDKHRGIELLEDGCG